jgi:hypothetical protein
VSFIRGTGRREPRDYGATHLIMGTSISSALGARSLGLSLALLFAAACSSSETGAGPGCAALASCCVLVEQAETATCLGTVSEHVDEVCSAMLSAYESAGACSSTGTSPSTTPGVSPSMSPSTLPGTSPRTPQPIPADWVGLGYPCAPNLAWEAPGEGVTCTGGMCCGAGVCSTAVPLCSGDTVWYLCGTGPTGSPAATQYDCVDPGPPWQVVLPLDGELPSSVPNGCTGMLYYDIGTSEAGLCDGDAYALCSLGLFSSYTCGEPAAPWSQLREVPPGLKLPSDVPSDCDSGTFWEKSSIVGLCNGGPVWLLCDDLSYSFDQYDCEDPGEGWTG